MEIRTRGNRYSQIFNKQQLWTITTVTCTNTASATHGHGDLTDVVRSETNLWSKAGRSSTTYKVCLFTSVYWIRLWTKDLPAALGCPRRTRTVKRDIHITTGLFLLLLPEGQVQLIKALSVLVHAVPLVVCVLGGVGPGLHGAVGVHQNGLRRQRLDKVTVNNNDQLPEGTIPSHPSQMDGNWSPLKSTELNWIQTRGHDLLVQQQKTGLDVV